ncbi:glycosyltransferase family 2 protein [Pseudomonas sp.]|uniref:glycosyltransferase family 2 protein n=1 Tax=Pseudomonas sp. TaxID=306 RepID=UPI0028AABA20|nr:glycosyltransferase family 2 protein [Pseudomonas sp.]
MKKLISIIVPSFNEEASLHLFHEEMSRVIEQLKNYDCEMIFVNDGSTDNTQKIIKQLAKADPRVSGISLSRNFGKEAAMTAGLDFAKGDAVAIFDADLQDQPSLLISFVEEWEKGFDVVYAKRTHRDGESWLKKATASLFYKLMLKISKVSIPQDTGDCRLMSRRVVDSLKELKEHHRFMKGLFAWVGYPSTAVEYRRDPRVAGVTKFNYWKLWNFALEGITSFTIAPLKVATYLGFLVSVVSLLFGLFILAKTLIWGDVVKGYPTIMVTILFIGGVQLFFIGVLGEYLGRVFGETKGRPLYLIDENIPSRISVKISEAENAR